MKHIKQFIYSPNHTVYGTPSHHYNGLTLNVRGPSYLGLTRSISWLLMPWLLTSPGHQQPWHYWLCRICKSWFLSTCVISMCSNDIKCKYMFMFPLKNLARKGLSQPWLYPDWCGYITSGSTNRIQWQWSYSLLATRFAAYSEFRWPCLMKGLAFYED